MIPIPLNPNVQYRAPKGLKARDDNAVRGVKGDSNYAIEIYADAKGIWKGVAISTYEAYRIAREQGPEQLRDPELTQTGQPLVVRLMRDDILELEVEGPKDRRFMRVVKFDSTGRLNLIGINESNSDARVRAKELKYLSATGSSLQKRKATLISVSPSGLVSRRKII